MEPAKNPLTQAFFERFGVSFALRENLNKGQMDLIYVKEIIIAFRCKSK